MKRLLDVAVSATGLVLLSALLVVAAAVIFICDRHSPLYFATRVGRGGRSFRMVKIRTMVVDADRIGGPSTSAADSRVLKLGRLLRRMKLDEVPQLWNVLKGEMSLVGPRPNVAEGGTELYTAEERRLLKVAPGITDFASVVFSDEGEILARFRDPDLAYDHLIRPWKSRLGLLYVDHQTFWLDVQLILVTLVGLLSERRARDWVQQKVRQFSGDEELALVSGRRSGLYPCPPPGSDKLATERAPSIEDPNAKP